MNTKLIDMTGPLLSAMNQLRGHSTQAQKDPSSHNGFNSKIPNSPQNRRKQKRPNRFLPSYFFLNLLPSLCQITSKSKL